MALFNFFKIGILLSIAIATVILSFVFFTGSSVEEENISHLINVAGRERMLTQKMNKEAIEMVYTSHSKSLSTNLQASMNEFETKLAGLMYGDESLELIPLENKAVEEQFLIVEENWALLKKQLESILSNTANPEQIIEEVNSSSTELLNSIEVVVNLIDQHGHDTLIGLNNDKILLMVMNLLFLLALFLTWRMFEKMKKSEKKYRLLVDHSPYGILNITEGKVTFINRFGANTVGSHDILHKEIDNLINLNEQTISRITETKEVIEGKLKRTDGGILDIELLALPFDVMGKKTKMLLIRDITEEKRSNTKVKNISNELTNLKTALDVSSIFEITDVSGKILYVNEKFCEISKYTSEEVIGKTHRIINSNYHSKKFYKNLWTTILSGNVWEGQVRNKAKDGSLYWVETIIVPFINNDGKPYQFLTIRNDITDRKRAERELELLASQDELTKVTSRRIFDQKLRKAIEQKRKATVLYLDLDRFKYINDALGHSIGDQLLIETAQRLKRLIGSNGIISRRGGDEFSILLIGRDRRYASDLASQILNEIKRPFIIDEKEILVTCSIGISMYPHDGKDAESLTKHADLAMYKAKEKGKDNFSFYYSDMGLEPSRIMEIELELRKAVEKGEFVLHYQPKVHLQTGEIIGTEALIRWVHPSLGIISPGEFIPLAEETGLINPIGTWVLKEACVQNKKWQEAGLPPVTVAVNLSAYQFRQRDLVTIISNILNDTKLEPQYLELEITESISMLEEQYIIKQLHALQKLGIKLAIDDFGTGYSSLKYLSKFPVNTLKIDQSFIREIVSLEQSSQSSFMTNAIISLGKSLNLNIVAEGIEQLEQVQYLRKLNCDLGQGYYFSRPLPAHELEKQFTPHVLT